LWRRKVEHGSSDNHTEGITIIALVTDVLDLGIPANEIGRVTFYQTQMEKAPRRVLELRSDQSLAYQWLMLFKVMRNK